MSGSTAPMVELTGLTKRFDGHLAVDDLSLAVEPGTVCALLGQNGAGKTTTIRMLMDILAPDSGSVRLFGRPRGPAELRRVGYLPEERGLYRRMTVVDQLVFLAELHGVPRRRSEPLIARWLGRLELADWAKRKVETLSKGMQQKIQIVGTLLHEPDLLILDEPFSGLDPINQGLFRDLLTELKAAGKTVLFSTHIMEHAEKLCDSICIIANGQVRLAGDLATIRRERGGHLFELRAEGDLGRVAAVPGVAAAVERAGAVSMTLAPGAVPARVLAELVSFLAVSEFRSAEPDLETIFLQTVGRHDA